MRQRRPPTDDGTRAARPPRHGVPDFPAYTAAEKAADVVIHALGIGGAVLAVTYLFTRLGPDATLRTVAALAIYGFGLFGMLTASALYNIAPPGRWKTPLLLLDHAMIFVMIAASYTPFAMISLRPVIGVPLCALIWALAMFGIVLRLRWTRLYKRISLGLYLGMGWVVLAVLPNLAEVLPATVLVLVVLGGVIYSLGSWVQTRVETPFHNAVWHAMVVCAAALHLVAIAKLTS